MKRIQADSLQKEPEHAQRQVALKQTVSLSPTNKKSSETGTMTIEKELPQKQKRQRVKQ